MTTSLTHISEKPWSDYEESDYTLEQWHAATLIHQHQGPPTSKSQCKLPVRTPNGALSRAGVHAAAGALAGARGGVNATAEEKAKAARALLSLYKQLGEDAPPSTKTMMQSAIDRVGNFLEQFGIKGQKWGVRRERGPGGTVGSGDKAKTTATTDAARASAIQAKAKKSGLESLSNEEMQVLVSRLNLQRQYSTLTARPSAFERGRNFVDRQLKTGKTVNEMIAFANSPAGKLLRSAMGKSSGRHARV